MGLRSSLLLYDQTTIVEVFRKLSDELVTPLTESGRGGTNDVLFRGEDI
jgi:hypothetical protein